MESRLDQSLLVDHSKSSGSYALLSVFHSESWKAITLMHWTHTRQRCLLIWHLAPLIDQLELEVKIRNYVLHSTAIDMTNICWLPCSCSLYLAGQLKALTYAKLRHHYSVIRWSPFQRNYYIHPTFLCKFQIRYF